MANMYVSRVALVLVGAFMVAEAATAPLDIAIDDADIRRASEIAMGSEAARARFHQLYTVPVNDPAIERMEVITEFRRFVMEAERQNALGNWMMARGGYDSKGRTLKDNLKASRGHVAIRVHMRFHPLNTYSAVPSFEIALGAPSLLTVSVARTPVSAGTPEDGTFLTGAIIETVFNAPSIGDAALPVQIMLDGKVIGRARVDFSILQ